jgi:hypothetical protein
LASWSGRARRLIEPQAPASQHARQGRCTPDTRSASMPSAGGDRHAGIGGDPGRGRRLMMAPQATKRSGTIIEAAEAILWLSPDRTCFVTGIARPGEPAPPPSRASSGRAAGVLSESCAARGPAAGWLGSSSGGLADRHHAGRAPAAGHGRNRSAAPVSGLRRPVPGAGPPSARPRRASGWDPTAR